MASYHVAKGAVGFLIRVSPEGHAISDERNSCDFRTTKALVFTEDEHVPSGAVGFMFRRDGWELTVGSLCVRIDDGTTPCTNCRDGRFYYVNGRGQRCDGGACYRCLGKARQTEEDRRRNAAYDSFRATQAIRADMAQ